MNITFNMIGLLCTIIGAIFISASNLPDDTTLLVVILWSMFCGLMSTEIKSDKGEE